MSKDSNTLYRNLPDRFMVGRMYYSRGGGEQATGDPSLRESMGWELYRFLNAFHELLIEGRITRIGASNTPGESEYLKASKMPKTEIVEEE